MKADEIRGLADDELKTRINELEEERFRLNFRAGSEALEEPLRLRSIRRDIARLYTVARERVLGIVRESSSKAAAPVRGAKKGAAKKGAAKKGAGKKGAARKCTAKKSTAKKSTAKKSTAKKGTAKKSTATKAAAKKATKARGR